MLVDQGVIARAPRALVLPDTVQALLAARIDLLSPDAKAALQAAAVVGPTFGADSVRALIGEEPRLDVLAGRGFVRSSEDEVRFTHALTRDVAYGSLTTAGRPDPRRVRQSLEEAGPAGRGAAELAHHYSGAVRPEDVAWQGEEEESPMRSRAVIWLRRAAGLAATLRDAPKHALRNGRRARARPRHGRRDLAGDRPRNVLYRRQGLRLSDGGGDRARRRRSRARRSLRGLAFQTMARAGMWGRRHHPTSCKAGSTARSSWQRRIVARAKALIARCSRTTTSRRRERGERDCRSVGDPALRSRGHDVATGRVRRGRLAKRQWCPRRSRSSTSWRTRMPLRSSSRSRSIPPFMR